MKSIFSREIREKIKTVFQLLHDLSRTQTIQNFLETVVLYILSNVDQMTYEDLTVDAENAFQSQGGAIMPTIAEQLIMKRKRRGVEIG